MSYEPCNYVRHILTGTDYLLRASDGLSEEAFLAGEILRRAFVVGPHTT